jgi:hypothetical protein
MNFPHLHLILNHIPTVGTAAALGVLLLGVIRKQEALTRAALEAFCLVALLTLPAYLSGVATQALIKDLPGVSAVGIERHHDAAIPASLLMVVTGLVAWIGLWRARRASRTAPRAFVLTTLVLAALTLMSSGNAASIGGEIRHPEILVAEAAPPAATAGLTAVRVAAFVNDHTWLWPSLEALHFVALWLLFGVVLVVNLRLVGLMTQAPFSAFHRLLPWAVLGLFINLITGMLFFIALPGQYVENVAFFWKMGLLLLAGVQLLYVTTCEEPWSIKAGQGAPLRARALAVSGIGLWLGVMFYGRMLPFIGNAF